MKNRVIAMLLCITTALGCLTGITVPVSAANTEGYYTYTVSNGEATITDVSTSVSGDVVIPDTLGGYPVVEIGYDAFNSCSRMTSLTIPATVTAIAPGFRECTKLTNIYYCGSLKQWCEICLINYFPEESLWLYADNLYIEGEKICGDLVIPKGVTVIGSGAFYGCKELTSVTIPEGVTKVGISAFGGCTKLTSVVIPASVTTICEAAFRKATNIYYNGNLEQWANINFEKYEYGWIPFASNSRLYIDEKLVAGDVVIPDGVTNISKHAFGLFRDITALTIPASVTNIEAGAVSDLDKLTGVWVSENNQNYCSDEFGVLFNKDKTELIAAPKTLESYTIPNSVTEIANYAFSYCKKLTDIAIPEGVKWIPNYTFYYCTNLKSLISPKSISSVGMAFGGCKNLNTFIFKGDAPYFADGTSDIYAFDDITATAFYPANNNTWTSDVMQNYGGDITWVPYDTSEVPEVLTYKIANGQVTITNCDKNADNEIIIPLLIESCPVLKIGAGTFKSCENITGVSIPETVTTIESEAFSNCTNLTEIVLPRKLSKIPEQAFAMSGLKTVTIPSSVTTIEKDAFLNCDLETVYFLGTQAQWDQISIATGNDAIFSAKLFVNKTGSVNGLQYLISMGKVTITGYTSSISELTIPETIEGFPVTAIGDSAFEENSTIRKIILPDSIIRIGSKAFYFCKNLTAVTMSNNLTSIEHYAFGYCTALEQLHLPDSVSEIGSRAFTCCISLTSITVPGSVTEIKERAFDFCRGLVEITFQDGVSSIGKDVFYECNNLQTVNLPKTLISIDDGAFARSGLTSITIPASVTKIGSDAFELCYDLKTITFKSNAPTIDKYCFHMVTATAYYPAGNDTWTSDVMQDYGGDITWVPYEIEEETIVASGICGENLTWELNNEGMLTISGTGEMYDFCFDWDTETETINPWKDLKNDIEAIVVNQGVTNIGDFAFDDCSNLTIVSLPSTLTSLGRGAFASCTKLDNVVLPDTLTYINETAFYNCDSLTSITIPGNVKYIYYVFAGCDNLTNVIIQEGVTNITESAFVGCRSLTTIIIPDSVTTIGTGAFEACTSMTNIILPEGLTKIFNQAFAYCSSLTSINIPEGVTNIGQAAFGNCTNLSKIIFEGDAPSIDYGCFDTVTATAYYPAGNDTWTSDVMQDYGGDITWVPYDDLEELKPGDIDGNGEVNRDDVVQLLLHISMPAAFPISVPADFNGDGQVTRDDVIQLLLHVSMPDAFPL